MRFLSPFSMVIFSGCGLALTAPACGEAFDAGCRDTLTCSQGADGGLGGDHAQGGRNQGGKTSETSGGAAAGPSGGDAGSGGMQIAGSEGGRASNAGAGGGLGAGGDGSAGQSSTVGRIGDPCAPNGAYGCAGEASQHQVVCVAGKWNSNGTCPNGSLCDAQEGPSAGTCRSIVVECANAQPGDHVCNGQVIEVCTADATRVTIATKCPGDCVDGACVARSCRAMPTNCGPSGNEDCCSSPLVSGGSFFRTYDGVNYTDAGYPASVSGFRLDRFEVSVGRFRRFVAAWNSGWRPEAGDGRHLHLNDGRGLNETSAGAAYELGWDPLWTNEVSPTDVDLSCKPAYQTWTSTAAERETRPMVCANWYEAVAFCTWDGGFLPSLAEWNYAASGGSEQRSYPWSRPPTSQLIDCAHANYAGGAGDTQCVVSGTADVGKQSPLGDGKFNQTDLSGNVAEWLLDAHSTPANPCMDCSAAVQPTTDQPSRQVGGGSFYTSAASLLSAASNDYSPRARLYFVGFRCARTPAE